MQIQIPYMSGAAVLLFARSPAREGRSKPIGIAPERTHRVFLESILRSVGSLDDEADLLLPSDHGDELHPLSRPLVGSKRRIAFIPIAGDGFGTRLYSGFAAAFASGHSRVVAVMGDCPELRPRHLNRAMAFLRDGVPSVIGPSPDGGLYLLGLSRLPRRLFAGVTFRGPSTRAQLVDALRGNGLDPLLLESVSDVDSDEDLWRLRQRLERLVPGSALARAVNQLVTVRSAPTSAEARSRTGPGRAVGGT